MMKSSQSTLLHITPQVTFLLLFLVLLVVQPSLAQSAKGENTGVAHRLKKLEQLVTGQQSEIENLKAQLAQETLARQQLESKLQYVSVVQEPINGLSGPHMIVEGCNLHVRSGSGDSMDGTVNRSNHAEVPGTTPTGVGNLIVGYNEAPLDHNAERAGSHNLIVGPGHNFTSVGSVVFGQENIATGPSTSVTGGWGNTANGYAASVSGGWANKAKGGYSGVSGGYYNVASGGSSSVSGGALNEASGGASSVSGGDLNEASGGFSSVSGGENHEASGDKSTVSGGAANTASGVAASVSGGYNNTASGIQSSVSGGGTNNASGVYSSVGGGGNRTATGDSDWVAGELFQDQ